MEANYAECSKPFRKLGMYMCDKPLPQQKLAAQLAEPIVTILDNPRLKSKTARRKASLAYLSTFWKTMVRELPGIDRHR
jgi:hypothetical protein